MYFCNNCLLIIFALSNNLKVNDVSWDNEFGKDNNFIHPCDSFAFRTNTFNLYLLVKWISFLSTHFFSANIKFTGHSGMVTPKYPNPKIKQFFPYWEKG